MTGDELKRHMQAVLPLELIEQLAKEYKFVERERRRGRFESGGGFTPPTSRKGERP